MSEEAAFLRAICDEPDEDTPRLAFADWLDEQGGRVNATWAEFIRVQIALDRDPASEGHLRPRERELEWFTGLAWTERLGLPNAGHWGRWVRGFPEKYYTQRRMDPLRHEAVPVAAFERAPRIPVRAVEVTHWTVDTFGSFLKWPGVRSVRELTVGWVPEPFAPDVRALAACEHLGALESLQFWTVDADEATALALLDSPHMARLTTLRVRMPDPPWGLSATVQRRFCERFGDRWDRF